MDFFVDGGFQQLFCDLNEQIEEDYNSWQLTTNTHSSNSSNNNHNSVNLNKELGSLDCPLKHLNTNFATPKNDLLYATESFNYKPEILDLNEKSLQNSLDYILQNSCDSLEYEDLSSLNNCLSKDLCDWEYNFLDNFIEIPELVDILPEKTPLCTDLCNHFLQESAANLKLSSSSGPSSPATHDKSYPCTFGECRKIYAKPAHLKAHLRRHLGEKPYVCNWPNCTWRFSRSDELARHRRSHSGIKPYKCDFCAKCFARSDHLTKHRKVHERRLLAASKAGKTLLNGELPPSVLTVRPGRKRKNQF